MPTPLKQLDEEGLAHLWEKIKEQNNVISDTSANWATKTSLVSKQGTIYIYTDYQQNSQGEDLPGFKVGDGLAQVVDLPFANELEAQHIADNIIHITASERTFWNNKVRCYTDPTVDAEELIFTTN